MGFQAIAEALGLAAVKAIVAIAAIIAGGRLVSWTFIEQIFHYYHVFKYWFDISCNKLLDQYDTSIANDLSTCPAEYC